MKLAINLGLSFGMLALCAWLVWPDAVTRHQLEAAFEALEWRSFAPYLFGYIGLLVIVQLTALVSAISSPQPNRRPDGW